VGALEQTIGETMKALFIQWWDRKRAANILTRVMFRMAHAPSPNWEAITEVDRIRTQVLYGR